MPESGEELFENRLRENDARPWGKTCGLAVLVYNMLKGGGKKESPAKMGT